MNYRHIYHAGNFADVFKHVVLTALVKSFLHKESAFCYLDTHAGIGRYNLLSSESEKKREYYAGINKIIRQQNAPALIQDYLQCVNTTKGGAKEFYYPGSPLIARHFLRSQDRMVLAELHSDDFKTLKNYYQRDKQVTTHCQDGYQALKAYLPPQERRGLVLIDPPYENVNEFDQLLKTIPDAVKRFETGVFAIWYPIKNRRQEDRFINALQTKISRPLLFTEMSIYPENTLQHLNGSGMAIINPPWKLEQELKETIPWLWNHLSIENQGSYRIF
jgi:23S rRNA (adenine2030-N6)-methyltransferase